MDLIAGATYRHRPGASKARPQQSKPHRFDDAEAMLRSDTVQSGRLAGGGGRLDAAGWTDNGMGGTSIVRMLDDQPDKLRFDMTRRRATSKPRETLI
jgi:hypothetical protein